MSKKIFIVIDMQNDFIDGSLPAEGAKEIIKPLYQKIEAYLQQGITVVYTMDTHYTDYLQTEEGKNLPILHCQKGSKGWQLVDTIYKNNAMIFEKSTFIAYSLVEYLKNTSYTLIELAGLCTDICILENALYLQKKLPHLTIAVHKDLTAGTTKEKHASALQLLKEKGITIL